MSRIITGLIVQETIVRGMHHTIRHLLCSTDDGTKVDLCGILSDVPSMDVGTLVRARGTLLRSGRTRKISTLVLDEIREIPKPTIFEW